MEKITLTIVDRTGHTTQEFCSCREAIEKCREYEDKGYWITIDGKFAKSGEITEEDIQNAKDITLVTEIQGG